MHDANHYMIAIALASTTPVLIEKLILSVTAYEPRVHKGEQAYAVLLFVRKLIMWRVWGRGEVAQGSGGETWGKETTGEAQT